MLGQSRPRRSRGLRKWPDRYREGQRTIVQDQLAPALSVPSSARPRYLMNFVARPSAPFGSVLLAPHRMTWLTPLRELGSYMGSGTPARIALAILRVRILLRTHPRPLTQQCHRTTRSDLREAESTWPPRVNRLRIAVREVGRVPQSPARSTDAPQRWRRLRPRSNRLLSKQRPSQVHGCHSLGHLGSSNPTAQAR